MKAPATDSPGVIIGGIGRPSTTVLLLVVSVTFSEPLGIGVAVTAMDVVAAADASEVLEELPDIPLISCEDGILAEAPLDEGNRLADVEMIDCSLVDWAVLGSLVFDRSVDAVVAS